MEKIALTVALLAGLLFFGLRTETVEQEPVAMNSYGNITAEELKGRLARGDELILLDVRTPPEFNGPLGHIEGSLLIPVQELEKRVGDLEQHKGEEIIVIYRSGNRSRTASSILVKHGFHATNLLGGMKSWNSLDHSGIDR